MKFATERWRHALHVVAGDDARRNGALHARARRAALRAPLLSLSRDDHTRNPQRKSYVNPAHLRTHCRPCWTRNRDGSNTVSSLVWNWKHFKSLPLSCP
jgi:hypothetical protein